MRTLRAISVLFVVASLPLSAQPPSASATAARAAAPRATTTRGAKMLPGTGNVLTTIQGNALTSTNGRLSDALLRLRDARSGRIVASQVTDNAGLFAFRGIEPGTYIVEVMAADESTVLTASELLTVNSGDTISAIVKLPLRVMPFGLAAGHASTGSMAALAAQAASSGIVAIVPSRDATCPIQ
jgi:hypothetical protein